MQWKIRIISVSYHADVLFLSVLIGAVFKICAVNRYLYLGHNFLQVYLFLALYENA